VKRALSKIVVTTSIVLIVLVIFVSRPICASGRRVCNDSAAVANLRTINTAEVTYLSSSAGTYGSMTDLIDARLLDDTFSGTKAGYNYSIAVGATGYTAEAVPAAAVVSKWHSWFSSSTASTQTGRYAYYSVPDAVVRYSTNASLAPRKQAGKSVQ
jgi:hypothetical protein